MAKNKFYAVAVGRTPGIYQSWADTQQQIKGFSGPVFKGFPTRVEAEYYLKEQKANARTIADPDVMIYTDGGCINNPGPGGYGVLIITGKVTKEFSGGYRFTTNNRMELMACIVGLGKLKRHPLKVKLISDSKYVVDGIRRGWAKSWRKNGWVKSNKEKALNPDLWEKLLDLCEKHEVEFDWVKGHAGHPENERCDQLANGYAKKSGLPVDSGYEVNLNT